MNENIAKLQEHLNYLRDNNVEYVPVVSFNMSENMRDSSIISQDYDFSNIDYKLDFTDKGSSYIDIISKIPSSDEVITTKGIFYQKIENLLNSINQYGTITESLNDIFLGENSDQNILAFQETLEKVVRKFQSDLEQKEADQIEEFQKDLSERDLFDDNIWDINSLDDLQGYEYIELLSKSDDSIQFQFGKDFWKYDLDTGELYQYADFVSMRDDINGSLIYSPHQDERLNKDYGLPIFNHINSYVNSPAFEKISNHSLDNKMSYYYNSNNGIHIPFQGETDGQKQNKVVNQIKNEIKGAPQELKQIEEMAKATLSILSLFFLLNKKSRLATEKEKMIEKILSALEDGKITLDEVYDDKILLRNIPELGDFLKKFSDKKVSTLNMKTEVEKLIEDENVISLADTLSENTDFQEKLGNTIFERISEQVYEVTGLNQEEIKDLFSSAQKNSGLTIDEFSFSLISKNAEAIVKENGHNIDSTKLSLSALFIKSAITGTDKIQLNEKFQELEKLGNSSFRTIANSIKKAVNELQSFSKQQAMVENQESSQIQTQPFKIKR